MRCARKKEGSRYGIPRDKQIEKKIENITKHDKTKQIKQKANQTTKTGVVEMLNFKSRYSTRSRKG